MCVQCVTITYVCAHNIFLKYCVVVHEGLVSRKPGCAGDCGLILADSIDLCWSMQSGNAGNYFSVWKVARPYDYLILA